MPRGIAGHWVWGWRWGGVREIWKERSWQEEHVAHGFPVSGDSKNNQHEILVFPPSPAPLPQVPGPPGLWEMDTCKEEKEKVASMALQEECQEEGGTTEQI